MTDAETIADLARQVAELQEANARYSLASNTGAIDDLWRRAERAEAERDKAVTRCADLEKQFKSDMETTLRLLATIKYLIGIAERGEGREIRGDETAEQFVLGYVKKIEAENAALREELVDAWEAAVDWGAYAGEYFQNKWGLKDDIARLERARAAIDTARKP